MPARIRPAADTSENRTLVAVLAQPGGQGCAQAGGARHDVNADEQSEADNQQRTETPLGRIPLNRLPE
jgi:hypothetical protein